MPQLELTPVIDALDGMRAVHEKLCELGAQKARAVMENNTAGLADITKQENRLMNDSRALDRKRGETVAALAPQIGVDAGQITVSMLAGLAEPAERDRLLSVQAKLLQAIKEQKELNAKCRVLMEAHIEYAEMMLNLMVGAEDPLNNFYGASGSSGDKGRRHTAGILDKKA